MTSLVLLLEKQDYKLCPPNCFCVTRGGSGDGGGRKDGKGNNTLLENFANREGKKSGSEQIKRNNKIEKFNIEKPSCCN